ncbi:MAG: DUF4199 domain-containing protein [Bacteroidota bacterium]
MQKFKTEIKWAFIFTAVLLLWMIMEKLAGFHDVRIAQHPTVSMLFMIPAIIIYVLAIKEKRDKDYEGKMSWKQGLISGAIIGLIMLVLSPIAQVIISTVISPDYFANAIAHSVELGKVSQTDAEAYFNLKSYIIQAAVSAPLLGIVTAAVVSIFLRRG